MNKKLYLVLLFSLVTLGLNAAAQDHRNGNWWRDLAIEAKMNYATGFFDGLNLGHKFSYWKFMSDKQKGDCFRDTTASFESFSAKYLQNVTNSQLADGLDSFYSDYRNRGISIDDAVWLVLNSIAGTPQGDLDKMIENFRRPLR